MSWSDATIGMIEGMLKNAPIIPYIPAADVKRARKFYEQKVGLVPREEIAGGVVYECGDRSWIFLYPTPNAGTSKARLSGKWTTWRRKSPS